MAKRRGRSAIAAAWRETLDAERMSAIEHNTRLQSCGADGFELAKLVVAGQKHETLALARAIIAKVEGSE